MPEISTWLDPGGTDREEATTAIVELYARAGLGEPEVAWFSSPVAAMRERPRLISRVEQTGRREYGRAVINGAARCLCGECLGSSRVTEVVPVSNVPDSNTRLAETARHISDLVHSAMGWGLSNDDELRRHEGVTDPGGGWPAPRAEFPSGWFRQNQWTAFSRIWRREEVPLDDLIPYAVLAGTAGWWWFNDGIVAVCDRPLSLHLDERGRLHRAEGPALVYEDGFSLNVMDGILLPEWYFDDGAITIDRIQQENNLEVRRLLIDGFGGDRYMREAGGVMVHEDETGQLWSVLREILGWNRSDMRMVRVIDATPTIDSSRRAYWLHVPPDVDTARAAVAWTFGMEAPEYAPIKET